jgi:hypothetical protein
MSAIGQNAQLPYAGSSNLANSLGALFNGGNSKLVFNMPEPNLGRDWRGLGAADKSSRRTHPTGASRRTFNLSAATRTALAGIAGTGKAIPTARG